MAKYFDIKEDNMNYDNEDESRARPRKKSEKKERSLTEWLAWITEHKGYTIILLILIILGLGKIAKHFDKNI
jgi:hypothetical protein